MKHLIQLSTVLFLLVQTMGYSQSTNAETNAKKQEATVQIDSEKFKPFIGKYELVEANITLEIIQENDKMFLLGPGSKDPLIKSKLLTLHEPIRGVDLALIKDDTTAIKFTQNGYETTMKRINSETDK